MTLIEEVSNFRKLIFELENKIQAEFALLDSNQENLEMMCNLLVQMNLVKRDVGFVYDGVSKTVAHAMGEKNLLNASYGATVEKKMSYDRKGWQHKDLGRAVAQKISEMSVDMDTGEIVLSPEDMVVKLLDYMQPSYWRTTELSKVGINADNYCETGDLKTSIIVRKGNAE
jgi:hypothetical protein